MCQQLAYQPHGFWSPVLTVAHNLPGSAAEPPQNFPDIAKRETLMDDFEYVMHGLVYKYKRDDSQQGVGIRVEVSINSHHVPASCKLRQPATYLPLGAATLFTVGHVAAARNALSIKLHAPTWTVSRSQRLMCILRRATRTLKQH